MGAQKGCCEKYGKTGGGREEGRKRNYGAFAHKSLKGDGGESSRERRYGGGGARRQTISPLLLARSIHRATYLPTYPHVFFIRLLYLPTSFLRFSFFCWRAPLIFPFWLIRRLRRRFPCTFPRRQTEQEKMCTSPPVTVLSGQFSPSSLFTSPTSYDSLATRQGAFPFSLFRPSKHLGYYCSLALGLERRIKKGRG